MPKLKLKTKFILVILFTGLVGFIIIFIQYYISSSIVKEVFDNSPHLDHTNHIQKLGQLKQLIIAAITAILLLLFSVYLIITKIINKPINLILNAISQIQKGNYNVQLSLKTKDEFEDVGKAIAEMATQIQSSQDLYTAKVNQNTIDLMSSKADLEKQQQALVNILEDQKVLEQTLMDERDKMNLIIGSMGEGLLVVDNNYKISLINPTAEKLLETTEKEAIGKPWTEVVTAYEGSREIPFEQRTSIKVLNKTVTIFTTLDKDHYYKLASGRKFPVTSVTTPVIRDNKTIAAVKVFKDASVEKETNIIIQQAVKQRTREISEQQAQISAIVNNAGEGIVLTNDEGLIQYANPAILTMLGITKELLIGKDFASNIKAFDLKGTEIPAAELSDTAAITAKNQESKILIQAVNNQIAVIISAAPVQVNDQFIGVVRIIHDFTEDFNLQRQKDDFFSIASHELRTPLSVISGNLDTLLQGYGGSQITTVDQQMLEDSLTSADRLSKLVEDFLNISRLDQGRLQFTIQPVNHDEIVDSVVSELKQLAQKKNLSLTSTCQAKDQYILADPGLLKEILINLIGNSIKFTQSGGIMLETQINGNKLEIKITDTGMGIDPGLQNKLFHRFQQAMKRTLDREAGGTGLGLYISREFARAMNGDLILTSSELGQGTTFTLSLPLTNKP